MVFFYRKRSGTGYIRGRQMADHLGVRQIVSGVDPEHIFHEEVCIYVKMRPETYPDTGAYVDVVDGSGLVAWLKQHPKLGVIASSRLGQELMEEKLQREVLFIPQHHCNFEREERPDREVKVVGTVGKPGAIQYCGRRLEGLFQSIGLEFRHINYTHSREEVVESFKQLDVNINWRTSYGIENKRPTMTRLKNCLKLVNAASFGIPTVAFPEASYMREHPDDFIRADSIKDLVAAVRRLKDDRAFYKKYAYNGLRIAEAYHIDNIAKLYRKHFDV